jgi:hypothetical protein
MARKGSFKDLIGMKFGRLTVVSFHHEEYKQCKRQKYTVRHWLCRCECGNEKVFSGPRLTKEKRTFSCGCLLREYKKTYESRSRLFKEGTPFRVVLKEYKRGARERGFSWNLSDEQFKEITSLPCHYTGALPSTKKIGKSGEQFVYNGIDRVDSSLGYASENCVPCCTEINLMKRNLPLARFIELCKKVAERFPNV